MTNITISLVKMTAASTEILTFWLAVKQSNQIEPKNVALDVLYQII